MPGRVSIRPNRGSVTPSPDSFLQVLPKLVGHLFPGPRGWSRLTGGTQCVYVCVQEGGVGGLSDANPAPFHHLHHLHHPVGSELRPAAYISAAHQQLVGLRAHLAPM